MRTESVARFPRRVPPPAAPPARESLGLGLLDARSLELLILNQHSSLAVHVRPQFFAWTQGLLQALLPHRVLVCALQSGEPASFRADAFSTAVPAAGALAGLLLRDAAALPGLVRAWKQRQCLPVACEAGETAGLAGGVFARELARIGASHLVVHGCHDVDGEASALYVLACAPEQAAVDRSYLLQLCLPFLHAAWIRSQVVPGSGDARPVRASGALLTAREREILRWIYLGKSNAEIGAILRISPMTVKNHVQKILRKLDVVNRAQAVGKALDAQIIGP
ncbi:MAG TPA: XrtB/PEP-CTERM-associated transcriptional regulator EpsA [Steroidobacteraceae bacterium]|jgi:transcriptional regulator EpsA